jgi:hypothetical protein
MSASVLEFRSGPNPVIRAPAAFALSRTAEGLIGYPGYSAESDGRSTEDDSEIGCQHPTSDSGWICPGQWRLHTPSEMRLEAV